MPYVLRNADGSIQAISNNEDMASVPAWESVDAHAPDYLLFLESAISIADPFRESDIHLARVLEDLINVLIERDVIRFTDLPEPARKRLLERQALRQKRTQLSDILDDASDGLI
ncbi:MAG: hypothetical protein Q8J65_10095 [Nitrosomonadales bacterium]|nr:hypothetical protein [Nitrosomonadales bacterium]